MQSLDRELTDKEMAWIQEFFKAKFNATEATRRVYGGTPGSCRVKGHRRLKRLEPILREIYEREFHKMKYQGINGVDFYLGDLERRNEEGRKYDELIKFALKSKRGIFYLEKAIKEAINPTIIKRSKVESKYFLYETSMQFFFTWFSL